MNELGLWHVLMLAALAVITFLVWSLPDRVRAGIPEPPDLKELQVRLGEIEQAAEKAQARVDALDARLRADAVTDYRRSVVQTLIGTVVGLVGGYMAGWVGTGGAVFPDGTLLRVSIATVAGLVFVIVAPLVLFRPFDWALGRFADLRQRRQDAAALTK